MITIYALFSLYISVVLSSPLSIEDMQDGSGTQHAIFPTPYRYGWTTSTSNFDNVQNIELSDHTLNVHRVSSGKDAFQEPGVMKVKGISLRYQASNS
jgi:hypothetical protein